MTPEEFLWNIAEEQANICRHHEDQRERMTQMIAVLSGGVVVLLSVSQLDRFVAGVLAGLLTLVGAYGTLMSLKHYERFSYHARVGRTVKNRLQERLPMPPQDTISELLKPVRESQKQEWPILAERSLYQLWAGLPAMIGVFGLVLLVLVVAGRFPK